MGMDARFAIRMLPRDDPYAAEAARVIRTARGLLDGISLPRLAELVSERTRYPVSAKDLGHWESGGPGLPFSVVAALADLTRQGVDALSGRDEVIESLLELESMIRAIGAPSA